MNARVGEGECVCVCVCVCVVCMPVYLVRTVDRRRDIGRTRLV